MALDLVGSVYDAALEPTLWEPFLQRLADAVGGSSAVLYAQDLDRNRLTFAAAARLEPTVWVPYGEYFARRDVWTRQAVAFSRDSVVTSPMLLAGQAFVGSEFYNGFLRPLDIFHLCSAVVENGGSMWASASVYRPERADDFGDSERRLMALLSPHLRNALHVHRRLTDSEHERAATMGVLDRLALGVVMLERDGRVIAMNKAARVIVDRHDGLTLDRHGLVAASHRQTTELRKLIHEAARTSGGEALSAGGEIAIGRPSGKRPLGVSVSPIRHFGVDAMRDRPAAVVFVHDPEQGPKFPVEAVSRLYGLTPAEARLAVALSEGKSLKEYAEEAAVTIGTARWRLKQVQAKTDTRRQSDLVRLILTGPAGFSR